MTEVPEELGELGQETSTLSAPASRPGGEDQGSSGHIGPFLKSCLAFCTALPLPMALWHTEHNTWVSSCQPSQGTGLLQVPVTCVSGHTHRPMAEHSSTLASVTTDPVSCSTGTENLCPVQGLEHPLNFISA